MSQTDRLHPGDLVRIKKLGANRQSTVCLNLEDLILKVIEPIGPIPHPYYGIQIHPSDETHGVSALVFNRNELELIYET